MLFKKKEQPKKASTLPPLPKGGFDDIKSSINKQEDLSELPELPSMPEFSPAFSSKIDSEFKPSEKPAFDMAPGLIPEFRPEKKSFTKSINSEGMNIGGFKFPSNEEKEKKMTVDMGEKIPFQPSSKPTFQPSFKFSDKQFQSPELREEAVKIKEAGTRISSLDKPIYVKIDKFKDALNTFEIVKKKIREIDSLLKKIKDTREKEQEELATWEQEITEIKEKINAVDSKLFSKLD